MYVTKPSAADDALQDLADNRWFKGLSPDILEVFAQSSRRLRLSHDEPFASRSGVAPGVALVIRGGIRSQVMSAGGRELVLSVVKPGGLWGLMAVMDGQGAVYDTRAHGQTELVVIPDQAFIEILDRWPPLYRHFARILCYRLRKAYGLVDELALVALRQRLARQLCALDLATQAANAAGKTTMIAITQDELAALLGVSRAAVNRELKRFERESFIDIRYGGIVVSDFVGLRALCEDQELFPW